ncbi:MAG TPA: tetratricopeptide repeat protein [bacterium]|nr:tetratricopeptide repeat protein [bacterium]HMW36567.1 tetratricopeptide repeat protein [bacterium]HMY35412.1 tetratricopeptide repeat protein [bacterium]HMZ04232.1 tetratricopeptide repeat protein [bacterium]HNB09260.1 tetratricopeptide repeat protein [bacterium]
MKLVFKSVAAMILLSLILGQQIFAQEKKKISHSASIQGIKQRLKNASNEPGDADKYYQQALEILLVNNAQVDKNDKEKEETHYYAAAVYHRMNDMIKAWEYCNKTLTFGKKYFEKGEKVSGGIELFSIKDMMNDVKLKTYNQGNQAYRAAAAATSPDSQKVLYHKTISKFKSLLEIDPTVTITANNVPSSYALGVYGTIATVYIQLLNMEKEEANKKTIREDIVSYLTKMHALDRANFSFVTSIISLYTQENNEEKMMAWMDTALAMNAPDSQAVAYQTSLIGDKALMLDRQGKADEAIAVYTKALEKNPENPDLHFNLGRLYYNRKDFDKANTQFRKVKSLRKDDPVVNFQVAEQSYQSYQSKRTETIDKNGGARADMNKITTMLKSDIEIVRTDIADAIASLEASLPTTLEMAETNYRIGKMYNYQAEIEGHLYYTLVNAEKVKKQKPYFEKAIPYLVKASELRPSHANTWIMLGTAYVNLQKKREAEAAFKKANEIK